MTAPKYVETALNPDLPEHMVENRVVRRARITKPRWNPKEWHPIYEEVVLLDCMGLKRSEIATRVGFTEEHVTNILKTEQAKIVRKLVIARINDKAQLTIEQRLEKVTLKAMDRVETVINDEELLKKNPLGIFDRAITLLKGTRKIQPDDGATHIHKAVMVTESQFDRLIKGTALADEAKRLHSGNGATPEMTEIVVNEGDPEDDRVSSS